MDFVQKIELTVSKLCFLIKRDQQLSFQVTNDYIFKHVEAQSSIYETRLHENIQGNSQK